MSPKPKEKIIMKKEVKIEMAKWLYKKGKEWINNSDLRHLDRTAKIFVELLEELDSDLADKLYEYYNR